MFITAIMTMNYSEKLTLDTWLKRTQFYPPPADSKEGKPVLRLPRCFRCLWLFRFLRRRVIDIFQGLVKFIGRRHLVAHSRDLNVQHIIQELAVAFLVIGMHL
jgi:hypothetical protein